MTLTFFGSSAWRRWKSAPAGNSSVSISPSSVAGLRLAEQGRDRDRARLDGGKDRSLPGVLELVEPERRRLDRRRRGRGLRCDRCRLRSACGCETGAGAGAAAAPRRALLELVDPEGQRLAGEVGAGARHLDERELERQPWVGALARVLDRDGKQVAEPQHGRRRQLVRLLAQPLARLVGDGQGVGHVAHVLDEQQVAQVLEQVGDEPAEILALLGELLEEDERTRRVAVDDRVAEAEERVLLDCAE